MSSIDRSKLRDALTNDEAREHLLADPAARREYERLLPRYALIGAVVGARKARGWTQSELATACGSSQSAIARLESGDHDPRWSTAVRVCDVLGIPVTLADGTRLAG